MADKQNTPRSVSNPPPEQAVPLQPLAAQPQPPPQTRAPYYPQPAYPVVLTQPAVATQQTFTGNTSNLPKYAFLTSITTTVIFTLLCWVPGLFCLVPATILGIVALHKKDKNKPQEAKLFSIISFVLVLIFVVSYPILVATATIATVFGYWCQPQTSYSYGYNYYTYSYGRYSYTYSRC